MPIQIKRMDKVPNPQGDLRAWFDVETKGYVFFRFQLVEGPDGKLYAKYPLREYITQGRKVKEPWYRFKDLDMLRLVTEEARGVYDRKR